MNIIIKNRLPEVAGLLDQNQTLTIMGMPSGGITVLLRELSQSKLGYPVFIDVFGLPALSGQDLLTELAGLLDCEPNVRSINQSLADLAAQKGRVVIYLAGIDQLQLDAVTIQSLLSIIRHNPDIRMVFGLCLSLKKFIPDAHFDSGLRLLGNKYYIGGYSSAEQRHWLGKFAPQYRKAKNLDESIDQAGGHLQLLLELLSKSPALGDAQSEPTSLLFKNMYSQLLGPQRTALRSLANGRRAAADEYLEGIGLVKNGQLFSPLFASYLRASQQGRLPHKERRLYLLLKRHAGSVVSKQEIIDVVWQGEIVNDWALNALVYRLRRHPVFVQKGQIIESHKKLGYGLAKS